MIDWIYIDDVVDGLIGCAQTPGISGRTIELGSGEMHSIREIVQVLREFLASPVEPEFGALPDRPLEQVRKADIANSYKLIGWQPATSLREGLSQTVEWYRRRANSL